MMRSRVECASTTFGDALAMLVCRLFSVVYRVCAGESNRLRRKHQQWPHDWNTAVITSPAVAAAGASHLRTFHCRVLLPGSAVGQRYLVFVARICRH